ncbi:TraM recognition domain-containing protein [Coxiella burnetii]|uniref:TraM recognition domain-containing protein n=1 Tax=Coxiella burnetii TaxID=777 RepID=UPI000183CDA1|nr:TraM recognition domain-containing protein [Coxiella burnetii]ACJ17822.1 IcmO [Coxiella burnetii CbuG_Q212]ATN66256.1 phosphoesterase [Coxiella burnetii]OYK86776.1 phosphoesterase [Coxiella burnetii]
MAYQPRGLEEKHERFHSHVLRDTRTLSVRMADFLKNPRGIATFLLLLAIITFFISYFSDVILLLGIGSFIYTYTRKYKLPFRLPQHSHMKDYNDPLPGTRNKPRQAQGIYYFGNEGRTKEELWFSNEDMRTHVLIFGSTGSGKTEAMVSIAYNALLQASGFIYVDGKGDNSLFAKVFSMVRSMGREDDLLLINFMTGAKDIIGPQEKRLSNTLNPFANGSSSMLSQLIVSMMDKAAGTPDGDMWKGRAIAFTEALMKILVAMRDAGHILLDANTIRNYFHLPKLEAIVVDKLFLREGEEPINLENVPPTVIEPIVNYVLTLPGYNKEKKGKQVSQVLEQHGFITMQLVRVFTSLADTYGHIMRTNLAEVDLRDVVLNRRILCVLLPALEKSPDELSNLGKVIVSTLKAMMASGLGEHVEGEYSDLVDAKPTNSKTPFLCVLDEYGYYAVEGFAVVPAQARSLGFSIIFAGQDLPAFQKASKEEAASIGANTNIKVCMKLEDPTETWDFFMKSAGESYVTHVESFQVDQGSVLGTYQDGRGARVEKRARIDLLDLKEQLQGEAHFFFKSKIVRGKFFYADPKRTKHLRLNHFLKVEGPSDSEAKKLIKSFEHFEKLATKDTIFSDVEASNEEVEKVSQVFSEETHLAPFDRSIIALKKFFTQTGDIPTSFLQELSASQKEDVGYLSLFTPLRLSDHIKEVVISSDLDNFKKPILDRAYLRDQIEYIQRLCGKSSQQAMNIAVELISDMEKGTRYPPKVDFTLKETDVAEGIRDMIQAISLKKKEAAEKADNKS